MYLRPNHLGVMPSESAATPEPLAISESTAPPAPASEKPRRDSCQFTFADGRMCRMRRSKDHESLCVFHAREERELLASEEAARLLLSFSGEFNTATDVNRMLTKIFVLMANNRISRKDAMSLAYVAQVVLQSLPQVRYEIQDTFGERIWHNTVKIAHSSSPLPPQQQIPSVPPQPVGEPQRFDNAD